MPTHNENQEKTTAFSCVGVGLSGGVDSTAAALKLLQAGYNTIGFTMLLTGSDESPAEKGAAVAQKLGIPHHILDFREEFRKSVITPFLEDYSQGRTPSPCVLCNSKFKFGAMARAMASFGCDAMATGHYAILKRTPTRTELHRGADAHKDQSYFLAQLTQDQLSHALFPLGNSTKDDIRALVAPLGIVPSSERESQDLCFIPDGDTQGFIAAHCPELVKQGDIVTLSGQILGHHQGACFYTRGQRRGLGLGGGPWFVKTIDVAQNQVIIAHQEDLQCQDVFLNHVNWLVDAPADGQTVTAEVQVRYLMKPRKATLTPLPDNRVQLHFQGVIPTAPPGQLAVAYQGTQVLASGWIE